MKIFPTTFKNCLTRKAAQTLNDLCHWANNFAQGFGIKIYRGARGVSVGVNPADPNLIAWLKEVSAPRGTQDKVAIADNSTPANSELWNRTMDKDLEVYLPCSIVYSYNGDADCTALVMKKFTFGSNGTLISVSDRKVKSIYGQS